MISSTVRMARLCREVFSRRKPNPKNGKFPPSLWLRYILAQPTKGPAMDLRTRFTQDLKAAMLAGDAPRVSTLRMITAKLKDTDIAARPGPPIDDAGIVAMLRGMGKSRAESVALYRQGGREELAAKEEAEIAVIEAFLPRQMDDAGMQAAVDAAIAETGAATIKDMGKVMAALRARHAAVLDMAKAGPMVKARLGG
jgi:uncharacterized protein YqeY